MLVEARVCSTINLYGYCQQQPLCVFVCTQGRATEILHGALVLLVLSLCINLKVQINCHDAACTLNKKLCTKTPIWGKKLFWNVNFFLFPRLFLSRKNWEWQENKLVSSIDWPQRYNCGVDEQVNGITNHLVVARFQQLAYEKERKASIAEGYWGKKRQAEDMRTVAKPCQRWGAHRDSLVLE